jgi:hypothetical protein
VAPTWHSEKEFRLKKLPIAPDVHTEPAWRERGDVTLRIKLEFKEDEAWHRIEGLWCRRVSVDRFELCCIPFFAYNLALGDVMIAKPEDGEFYAITGVAKTSGHSTFRATFEGPVDDNIRGEMSEELRSLNCLFEWYPPNDLLAIDAASREQALAVAQLLEKRKGLGQLTFELSHTAEGHRTSNFEVKVHKDPVWRERADYILHGRIEHEGVQEMREQLWARTIDDNRFEVCCIPFFVYDLALGDEVETEKGVIEKVVKPSGHQTFWIWFDKAANKSVRGAVYEKLTGHGCLVESYSPALLAFDAQSDEQARVVCGLLEEETRKGFLECVPGRSDWIDNTPD